MTSENNTAVTDAAPADVDQVRDAGDAAEAVPVLCVVAMLAIELVILLMW